MPEKVQKQLDDDAQFFLKALINELQSRDDLSHLIKRLRDASHENDDDPQNYRDLCIARRAI